MVELKNVAISVAELRSVGAGGYSGNVLMVPLTFANDKVMVVQQANEILLKENGMWAKEVEKLRNENLRLKKELLKKEKF